MGLSAEPIKLKEVGVDGKHGGVGGREVNFGKKGGRCLSQSLVCLDKTG